jgi:hypothetical protein
MHETQTPTRSFQLVTSDQGRWVVAKVYAERSGIHIGTLANWRHKDLQEGRDSARPGYPVYRRFGAAVRYWMDSSFNMPPTPRKSQGETARSTSQPAA